MKRETSDRRLLKLAAFLKNLPEERFNYETWVGYDWGGKEDLSCGTTACALGWATTIPEFHARGLRLTQIPGWGAQVELVTSHDAEGKPLTFVEAGARVFGLTLPEGKLLFIPYAKLRMKSGKLLRSPHSGATAKAVARHIERFVAARQADPA